MIDMFDLVFHLGDVNELGQYDNPSMERLLKKFEGNKYKLLKPKYETKKTR